MSLRPSDGVPRLCPLGRILTCQSQDAAERRVVSLNLFMLPGGDAEAQTAKGAQLSSRTAGSLKQQTLSQTPPGPRPCSASNSCAAPGQTLASLGSSCLSPSLRVTAPASGWVHEEEP